HGRASRHPSIQSSPCRKCWRLALKHEADKSSRVFEDPFAFAKGGETMFCACFITIRKDSKSLIHTTRRPEIAQEPRQVWRQPAASFSREPCIYHLNMPLLVTPIQSRRGADAHPPP